MMSTVASGTFPALERLEPGFSLVTATRIITEADVDAFATLTGDLSPLHRDDEYARASPYGRRIVHGALVFSISVGLTTETGLLSNRLVAFSRVENLRFVRPVFLGDAIGVAKTLISIEQIRVDRTLLGFDTRVRNQNGEIVLAYVDKLLIARGGPVIE